MELWINPACSTCQAATELPDEAGVQYTERRGTGPRAPASRPLPVAELLSAHPSLIQRPIITADDGTTAVGRTPEAVRRVM